MRTCLGMLILAVVLAVTGGTIVYQTYTNSGIRFEQKARHSEFANPKGKPGKGTKPSAKTTAAPNLPTTPAPPVAVPVEEPPIAEPVPE